MRVPKFYGKEISEFSKLEHKLFQVDTMLLTSLRLKDNNQRISVGNMELGSDKCITKLSSLRWDITLELMGFDEDSECNQEAVLKIENSPYSWANFIKNYMIMGNVIGNFVEEVMGGNKKFSDNICLN